MKSKYSTTRLDNHLKRVVENIAEESGVPQIQIVNTSLRFGIPFAQAEMENAGSDFRLGTVLAIAKTYLQESEQPEDIRTILQDAIHSVETLRDLMVKQYAITAPGNPI